MTYNFLSYLYTLNIVRSSVTATYVNKNAHGRGMVDI